MQQRIEKRKYGKLVYTGFVFTLQNEAGIFSRINQLNFEYGEKKYLRSPLSCLTEDLLT